MTEYPEQPEVRDTPSDEGEEAASEAPDEVLSDPAEVGVSADVVTSDDAATSGDMGKAVASETPAPEAVPEPPAAPTPEVSPEAVVWEEPVAQAPHPVPAAPEPVPAAPETMSPEKRARRKKLIWTIVWVALGLLVACGVTAFFVGRPYVIGSKALPVPDLFAGDRMVVGFASRGGTDFYLLKTGQDKSEGILLAEDAQPANVSVVSVKDTHVEPFGRYGGFVPGLNWLVLWYGDGERTVIEQMRVGDASPTRVLASKGDQVSGGLFLSPQELFVSESREGRSRCYVARPGGKAVRVARADRCTPSLDGSTLFLQEVYTDETMLSAVRMQGDKETILLDDVPGVMSFQSTVDGTAIAYVLEGPEGQMLYRVDRTPARQASGEALAVSDEVPQVVDYGFAPNSDVLFYVVQDDEMQLYLSTGAREIASGEEISARFTPDGQYLVFQVTSAGAESISVISLSEEASAQVVIEDSGLLAFEVVPTETPQLLIATLEEEVTTVRTAGLDGTNLQTVFEGRGMTLQEVLYVEGEAPLYVLAGTEAGGVSLYAAGSAERAPIPLLEDWSALQVVNRSLRDGQLAFTGQPQAEDPVALYVLSVEAGASPVLLDDEHVAFGPAVFAKNAKSLLYTAYIGDGVDEVDVCQVPVEGGAVEVLYEKTFLVDVRWDSLVPFWSWGQ